MLEDMDRIAVEYATREQFSAAQRLTTRIYDAAQRLTDFPFSGRIVEAFGDPSVREIIVQEYRVIYQVTDDAVKFWMVYPTWKPFPLDELNERRRFG